MTSNETGVGKNGEKNADFLPINRYISETIQERHSYNERLIGSCIFMHMGFRLVLINDLERP